MDTVAFLKSDDAILKGVDNVGNKYWEKLEDQYGTKDISSPGDYSYRRLRVVQRACHLVFSASVHTQELDGSIMTMLTMAGRHRWVEYASAVDYDPTSVPPEWHGWLHHITDHTPEQLEGLKSTRYGLEAWDKVPKYMAKGHALHPQRRTWKRFEAWQPADTGPAK